VESRDEVLVGDGVPVFVDAAFGVFAVREDEALLWGAVALVDPVLDSREDHADGPELPEVVRAVAETRAEGVFVSEVAVEVVDEDDGAGSAGARVTDG